MDAGSPDAGVLNIPGAITGDVERVGSAVTFPAVSRAS